MATIVTTLTRFVVLPVVSAGIIGGAAIGMAGTANAAEQDPAGSSYTYSPDTHAYPAPVPVPGYENHHGWQHIAERNAQMGL